MCSRGSWSGHLPVTTCHRLLIDGVLGVRCRFNYPSIFRVQNRGMSTAKKLTTAQIQIKYARNLPPRLLAIAREIEARAAKADAYHGKAADHVISIKQLLAEARSLCTGSGFNFNAFRKRYCPSLGRSRAYELLAIAKGKKSAQQIRQMATVRQARSVAKLKAAAAALRKADRPSLTDAPRAIPAPSRDGSDTVRGFTARVLELVLMTATVDPKTFNGVAIEADDLRTLADFLRPFRSSQAKTSDRQMSRVADRVRLTKSRFASKPLNGKTATLPPFDHAALTEARTLYPSTVRAGVIVGRSRAARIRRRSAA